MNERTARNWPRLLAWFAFVASLLLLYGILIARIVP
jgi:hypothetical protein